MTRKDLARRFASLGFTRGAEIGVERGKFSETLCRCIPGLSLLAVDAWATQPGYREHVTQEELDRFERETRKRLAQYNAHVIKGFSAKVAETVPNGSLDFVYIDAKHDYESVIADIEAWAPKVRDGGVIAGHDYNLKSVKAAVDGFVGELVEFYLTDERSPSWWVTVGPDLGKAFVDDGTIASVTGCMDCGRDFYGPGCMKALDEHDCA